MAEAARRTRILSALVSIAFMQFTSVTGQEPGKYDAEGNLQSNKLRGSLDVTHYPNSTHNEDIYIGQVTFLRLTVDFTDLPEATGTNVIIVLSSTATPILGFTKYYNPTPGEGLTVSVPFKDRNDWEHYYVETAVPKYSVVYPTEVVSMFGNVTHRDNGNIEETSDFNITVTFGFVCFGDNDVATGERFNTTVKVETSDTSLTFTETFVYQGLKTVDEEPSFTVTEVTEIEVLKPLIIQLDMFLPSPLSYVEITVYASQTTIDAASQDQTAGDSIVPAEDDTMANEQYAGLLVQDIKCVGSGRAFNHALQDYLVKVDGYQTCPLSPILALEVGPLVNTESQKENPSRDDNLLSFNVTLLITDPNIDRSEVFVGVAVNVNNKTMWASSLRLTVLGHERATNQESHRQPSLFLDSIEPMNRMVTNMNVSSGSKHSFGLRLETPPVSNRTYQLTIATHVDAPNKGNALRILAVTPEDPGYNLVCQLDNLVELVNRSEEDPSMWLWIYKLQIVNLGISDAALANTVKLGVTVVMLGNAMEDDTFTLTSFIDATDGPIVSFTVDAPAKARFVLVVTSKPLSYKYPGFMDLFIHTPPGTREVYNVTLTCNTRMQSWVPNAHMIILTVNLLGAGANVAESVKLEDIAVHFMNNSVMDRVTFSLVVKNTGESAGSGADDVTLEIAVLFKPTVIRTWFHSSLQATVNDIDVAYTRLYIHVETNYLEYNGPISATLERPDPCPGNVFSYGSVVRLLMNVVTYPDSTAGPLVIHIPWHQIFTVDNASVVTKGRNVVCVNTGSIITTQEAWSSSASDTVITLPMVCNRQRSLEFESDDDSDTDSGDAFTIEIYLALNGNYGTSPGQIEEQDVTCYINVTAGRHKQNLMYPMHLVDHWHDHGELKVVEKVHLVDPDPLSQNHGEYVLEWSMDGTDNVLTTLTANQVNPDQTAPEELLRSCLVRVYLICKIRLMSQNHREYVLEWSMDGTDNVLTTLTENVSSWVTHRQIKYTLNRQLLRSCLVRVYFICKRRLKSQNHGKYVLEWIMEDTDNVLTTLTTYSEEQGDSYLLPTQFPIFARFFRVLRRDDACLMNVTTTSGDLPIIHGPSDKTEPLLTNVLRMLVASSHHGGSCMSLPQPGDTEATPFLWIDIKTDLFRVKNSSGSLSVGLRGTGIQCNSRTGPQITMVVFPKERPAKNGEQQHKLCEVMKDYTTDYGQTVCYYKCECGTASECEQMTLLMMNVQKTHEEKEMDQRKTENGGAGMSNRGSQEQFSLCQFHIWQYQV